MYGETFLVPSRYAFCVYQLIFYPVVCLAVEELFTHLTQDTSIGVLKSITLGFADETPFVSFKHVALVCFSADDRICSLIGVFHPLIDHDALTIHIGETECSEVGLAFVTVDK